MTFSLVEGCRPGLVSEKSRLTKERSTVRPESKGRLSDDRTEPKTRRNRFFPSGPEELTVGVILTYTILEVVSLPFLDEDLLPLTDY